MPTFYHYDLTSGLYTFQEFYDKAMPTPEGATLVKPSFQAGYWPVWAGQNWKNQPDFRGLAGFVNGEYIVISELGPLPDGWSTEPPVFQPSEKSILQARLQQLYVLLDELDRNSVRPIRAQIAGKATEQDLALLAENETQAETYRLEVQQTKQGIMALNNGVMEY
jgi:hypothetical protein